MSTTLDLDALECEARSYIRDDCGVMAMQCETVLAMISELKALRSTGDLRANIDGTGHVVISASLKVEGDRNKLMRLIAGFPMHEEDRGPDNLVLLDMLPSAEGDTIPGGALLEKLTDAILALRAPPKVEGDQGDEYEQADRARTLKNWQALLAGRDEFIGRKGLWDEFMDSLPAHPPTFGEDDVEAVARVSETKAEKIARLQREIGARQMALQYLVLGDLSQGVSVGGQPDGRTE